MWMERLGYIIYLNEKYPQAISLYQLKMKIIVPINTSISHILSMQIGNDNINSVSNSLAFKDSSTNRKFNE